MQCMSTKFAVDNSSKNTQIDRHTVTDTIDYPTHASALVGDET